jgi:hypothetical protein
MIEVSVEVDSGTARLTVMVQAESIQQAMNTVKVYCPGAHVQVVHPIDPESFFVEDPIASAGLIDLEMLESLAG